MRLRPRSPNCDLDAILRHGVFGVQPAPKSRLERGRFTYGNRLPATSRGHSLSARISRQRLDRELALRGWTAQDLVRASGISGSTISAARQGKPVRPRSIHRIVTALLSAPVLDGVADLLDDGGRGS